MNRQPIDRFETAGCLEAVKAECIEAMRAEDQERGATWPMDPEHTQAWLEYEDRLTDVELHRCLDHANRSLPVDL